MRKPLIVLLVVLLVAAFALPTALAHNHRRGEHMKQKWDDIPEQKRERALQKAEKAKMFSKCTHTGDGWVQSRFVRFHYAKDQGLVHDLTVRSDKNASSLFFKEVKPLPFNSTTQPYVTGAVFHHQGTEYALRGHCNPTAVFGWWNGNGTRTVTFTLGANVTVAPNATTKEVRLLVDTIHGHILTSGNGTLTVVAGNVTAVLGPHDKVMFRAHQAMGASKNLHDQNSAFKSGKLGAVVHVVNQDGTAVTDSEDIDVETEARTIAKGKLVLVARGDKPGNRVLYITVDGDTFDVRKMGKIKVKVSGQEASNSTDAASLETSTTASANLAEVDGALQVAVNVPHFSEQTIEVSQEGETDSTTGDGMRTKTGTPGLGFALVALALLGLVAVVRRRSV